jgi:cystathionine beta-lyase/cystathionine gamma-synthase
LAGYSGLLSFELKDGTYDGVKTVINSLKWIKIGVSWGSFETLILSPNYGNNMEELRQDHVNPGLLRLAVGLESAGDIIDDLKQALDRRT